MSDLSREVVGWRNRARTAEREVQRLSHTRIALSLRVQELEAQLKAHDQIIEYLSQGRLMQGGKSDD